MFSQYVGSCFFPRPNVSGFHVPGEEKRGKANAVLNVVSCTQLRASNSSREVNGDDMEVILRQDGKSEGNAG
ncbi:hypothetical protein PRIPAC_95913 [Pristionchus pacificus]|uniref:Uncharacterized protein n=1 Tax=Pristionchus pacificus TaxID=54126 RepID=A0A2A6BJD1_PRIPA|nr:hypothetical protein PRIPAC_95913 [Pristionchus pacificus]|eukprot:PDM66009.1 hypothetical protein PRIPAC_44103 [Pristionchus pacificus]